MSPALGHMVVPMNDIQARAHKGVSQHVGKQLSSNHAPYANGSMQLIVLTLKTQAVKALPRFLQLGSIFSGHLILPHTAAL